MNNPNVSNVQTLYEYLEHVLEKGQARKCLDIYLAKWNLKLEEDENSNLQEAIVREVERSVWRIFYREKTVHDLRRVHFAKSGLAPVRAYEEEENPIEEPPDRGDFTRASRASSNMHLLTS